MKTLTELYEEWELSCRTQDSQEEYRRRDRIVKEAMAHFPGHDFFVAASGVEKDRTWADSEGRAPGVCSPNWWKKALAEAVDKYSKGTAFRAMGGEE
jgi:hypothetical protein